MNVLDILVISYWRTKCLVEVMYAWKIKAVCILDIDECLQGTAECNQGCNNTDGIFICTCYAGYELLDGDTSTYLGMILHTA